jgi:hypothetical protein
LHDFARIRTEVVHTENVLSGGLVHNHLGETIAMTAAR